MSPSPYWRRSFNSRSVSFFEGNDSTLTDIAIVRDLEAVRDILDESKDCVLPLVQIEPKRRFSLRSAFRSILAAVRSVSAGERICWVASGILISWLAWAVMSAPAPG